MNSFKYRYTDVLFPTETYEKAAIRNVARIEGSLPVTSFNPYCPKQCDSLGVQCPKSNIRLTEKRFLERGLVMFAGIKITRAFTRKSIYFGTPSSNGFPGNLNP